MKCVAQISLLLAAAAASWGCGGRRTIAQRLENMQANCVLIVIDAAAAKHLHTYGNARQTTPNLDRLASNGVLFERAYSQAPSTIVSVPSLMTGLYPHSIAVLREQRRAGSVLYLPQVFAAAGFRTAGFTENVVVALSLPGAKVFEHFGGHLRGPQAADSRGARLVGQALSWVDSVRGERFFVYLHLLPPMHPISLPQSMFSFARRTTGAT